MNRRKGFARAIGVAVAALFVLQALASAAEQVYVNANAGADHPFLGFGGSISSSSGGNAEAARKLYSPDESDFRIIRLWSGLGYSGDQLFSQYNGRVQDALRVQPDLIVLLAPCGRNGSPTTDVYGYASHYAEMIRVARSKGMPVNVTGIMNEPDDQNRLRADKVAPMVKAFREELDKRGLQDVTLIATENANVDVGHYEDMENIKNDPAALDALDGWAYHAYNCSITYIMRELMEGTGKTVWNTESCVDQWTTAEAGANSAQIAVNATAKILADLNMGTNYWIYFFSYNGGDSGVMVLSSNGGETLQYIYMRQIADAFDVGAELRYCLADKALPRIEMTWEFGQKPAITAAVAQNPDDSWAIGVCNGTGVANKIGNIASFYPAAAYDVTLHVEELEGQGDIDFRLVRSNKSVRRGDEGTVVMSDGTLEVSLNAQDLVTLRSAPVSISTLDRPHDAGGSAWHVRPQRFAVTLTLDKPLPYTARLFAMDGRKVLATAGTSDQVTLPAAALPRGVYLLRVAAGGTLRSFRVGLN